MSDKKSDLDIDHITKELDTLSGLRGCEYSGDVMNETIIDSLLCGEMTSVHRLLSTNTDIVIGTGVPRTATIHIDGHKVQVHIDVGDDYASVVDKFTKELWEVLCPGES